MLLCYYIEKSEGTAAPQKVDTERWKTDGK